MAKTKTRSKKSRSNEAAFTRQKTAAKGRMCPECGAKGGSKCKDMSGRPITWVHRARFG